jgi:Helix-turn-helix domain
MPRPEIPVISHGAVPDLARALRQLRYQAGQPSYRRLSQKAHVSKTALADAAEGYRRPTWAVTEAFVRACGGDPQSLRPLWMKANTEAKMSRRQRNQAVQFHPAAPRPRPGQRLETQEGITAEPGPWKASTPAQYVHQLRALRAWAGQPGRKEINRQSGRGMSSSTLYDALSPARTRLPSLEIVRAIVLTCASPERCEDWTDAWRALRLRQFEQECPVPQEEGPGADVLRPEAWRVSS